MAGDANDQVPPVKSGPATRLRQEMALFNRRREIAPLLPFLAVDIREKLAAAMNAGSAVGPEIAAHLHRLRDMELGSEESLAVIRAAANRVVDRYVAARERGGKLSKEQLDDIDVADIPAKTFAREFAVALAQQVTWKAQAIKCREQSASQNGDSVRPRDKELAGLKERSSWAISGTPATNADLLELAEEFPSIEVNTLRRLLVDHFAELGIMREPGSSLDGGSGRTFRIPVPITAALDRVRRELLAEVYGPPTSQISGAAAKDGVGELSREWFVVSQVWVDAALRELPVLNMIDIRMAFEEIDREILGAGSGVKAGPPLGLTWRRYGRGLQADAEAALKARLVQLAAE